MFPEKGALYIVATPIGNLADMSQRAKDVLSTVSVIAAEDTRRTANLLRQFNITARCQALHEHNEREVSQHLIERLNRGENLALVSDAGTPLLSDPGFHLVRAAIETGIKIIPIPGASALITALCAAGLPTDHFCFEGFLSSKAGTRLKQLEALQSIRTTLVFYEAPHRVLVTLAAMREVFGGDRSMVLARELTKTFETFLRGTIDQVLDQVRNDPDQQKGEMVILVHGAPALAGDTPSSETIRILTLLLQQLPVKQAATLAAEITGEKKNLLYKYALQLGQQAGD